MNNGNGIDTLDKMHGIKVLKKDIVYVVITNTDLTEGKGSEYPLAVTKLMSTARRISGGRYVQGTDCQIIQSFSFDLLINGNAMTFVPGRVVPPTDEDIFNDRVDKENRERSLKKENALKKARDLGLSEEEIKAMMF